MHGVAHFLSQRCLVFRLHAAVFWARKRAQILGTKVCPENGRLSLKPCMATDFWARNRAQFLGLKTCPFSYQRAPVFVVAATFQTCCLADVLGAKSHTNRAHFLALKTLQFSYQRASDFSVAVSFQTCCIAPVLEAESHTGSLREAMPMLWSLRSHRRPRALATFQLAGCFCSPNLDTVSAFSRSFQPVLQRFGCERSPD